MRKRSPTRRRKPSSVARGAKGEIDLVGYDGDTLALVEVRTRTAREDQAALPELSVTAEKAAGGGADGKALSDGAVRKGVSDADVVAIEEVSGAIAGGAAAQSGVQSADVNVGWEKHAKAAELVKMGGCQSSVEICQVKGFRRRNCRSYARTRLQAAG